MQNIHVHISAHVMYICIHLHIHIYIYIYMYIYVDIQLLCLHNPRVFSIQWVKFAYHFCLCCHVSVPAVFLPRGLRSRLRAYRSVYIINMYNIQLIYLHMDRYVCIPIHLYIYIYIQLSCLHDSRGASTQWVKLAYHISGVRPCERSQRCSCPVDCERGCAPT